MEESVTPSDEIEVCVGPAHEGAPGRCVRVDDDRHRVLACVEFSGAGTPTIPLGSRVELEFRSVDLGRALDTVGVASAREEGRGWRRYVFRCDLTRRVFLSLLNRRKRVRLHPGVLPTVEVLDVGDPPPLASTKDLSEAGLAIEVDAELEEKLFEREHLDLAVRLPGEPESMRVRAAVRHRRLVDGRVRYGLMLVTGDRGSERLASYVKAVLRRPPRAA